jgi:predicted RecA/RadA family phage recombinase
MAASFANPYGAVGLTDGTNMRTLTIKARATISGGWFVNGSSAVGVVSSGADSYAASDIEGYPVDTVVGSHAIGIAIQTIPSGTYGAVARAGDYILPLASGTKIGSIYPGWAILAGSAGTVVSFTSGTTFPLADAAGARLYPCGRAITAMDETGGFIVASLNF